MTGTDLMNPLKIPIVFTKLSSSQTPCPFGIEPLVTDAFGYQSAVITVVDDKQNPAAAIGIQIQIQPDGGPVKLMHLLVKNASAEQ